jgi:hypothetical protein
MAGEWEVLSSAPIEDISNNAGWNVVSHQPSGEPSLWQRMETSVPGRFIRGAIDPLIGMVQSAVNVGGYNPILDSAAGSTTGEPYSVPMQAAASDLVNNAVAGQERQYQAARGALGQSGIDLPRLAGTVAANLATGSAVSRLPVVGLLPRIAAGAAVGGTTGATAPVTDNARPYARQALGNATIGAGVGGLLPPAAAGLGMMVPKTLAAGARALIDQKLPLTIGQTMGGVVKSVEDKLTSLPVLGDAIKAAQGRATEGLNRTALNRALAPVGETLPHDMPVGRQAVEYVGRKLGDKYDALLPSMRAQTDQKFASEIQDIIADARGKLPPAQFHQFRRVVTAQLPFKAGGSNFLDGPTLQSIDSELGRRAAGYSGDASFDNRELGHTIGKLKTALSDLVARNNPDRASELKAINQGWANYVRVRRAASGVGAKDGVFSAPQLSSAVRASDKSVGKGDYAKGRALMQDLSDPAAALLPSSVPDSGTAGRLLLLEMARHPAMAVPGLFGSAVYSRGGQALLRNAVKNGPLLNKRLNEIGLLGTPFAGSLLAPALNNGQ